MAALAVAVAMAAELVARDLGRGGQVGLTSMMSTMGHVLGDVMIEYQGRPEPNWPDVEQLGYHALYRLYESADGWIVLCSASDQDWSALRSALPAIAKLDREDPTLGQALEGIFRTRPGSDWERELSAQGIGCAEVTPPLGGLGAGMFLPGQIGEKLGFITTVEHPIFGEHRRSTALVRLSRSVETLGAGCTIGQHTEKILAELGYDEDQIAEITRRRHNRRLSRPVHIRADGHDQQDRLRASGDPCPPGRVQDIRRGYPRRSSLCAGGRAGRPREGDLGRAPRRRRGVGNPGRLCDPGEVPPPAGS